VPTGACTIDRFPDRRSSGATARAGAPQRGVSGPDDRASGKRSCS
jgi:hypothetical protein